jgi:hypothetical protein
MLIAHRIALDLNNAQATYMSRRGNGALRVQLGTV